MSGLVHAHASKAHANASAYPLSPGFKEHGGTSEDAALAVESKAATLRGRALRLLQTGAQLTADEVAERLGESLLAIRPRISELSLKGFIERTGERRRNVSGHDAWVWRCRREAMPAARSVPAIQEGLGL